MEDFLVGLIAATLRIGTPLIFATLGELFCERAGILNLGIEGTMFFGAFSGFTVASLTGNLWLGLLGAILGGMLAGLVMSLFAVRLGVNQHVSGLGITLLFTALSLFGFRLIFGENQVLPSIVPFKQIELFTSNPDLHAIFSQYVLTYIAIAIIPVVWWILFKTNFGLKIRSVGDNPEATDAAGIDVYRLRTTALVIGGALMAVGGAFLSIAQLGSFTFGIVSGRGWVCIALIIFGNWHPVKVFLGALLFGGVQALQAKLQLTGAKLPYELFLALPYIVTIIALTLAGRNASYPAAMLKPYRRE
ncbi:MAG: ABC transporter permease [Chloroflexi bacterium]|nr:ABC transporter permease [Chloroflexota bacterium]